ncbi:MAG: hypothetical protein ACI81R_000033 [Bradymonadia bacterium]|jgi:hypothetical protein
MRNLLTTLLHRAALVTAVASVGACASELDHDGVELTAVDQSGERLIPKGTPTVKVQFRYQGSVITGSATACLEIQGFAPVPMTFTGSKWTVKPFLSLPSTYRFRYFESVLSTCASDDGDLWPGDGESSVAALRRVPVTACADSGGLTWIQAEITSTSTVGSWGPDVCPVPTETEFDLQLRIQNLLEDVAGDEFVCIQTLDHGTLSATFSSDKWSSTVADVAVLGIVHFRFYVSDAADCSTVVRFMYPRDGSVRAAGLEVLECDGVAGFPGELWHRVEVQNDGAAVDVGVFSCPDAFASEARLSESHVVGDTEARDELGSSIAADGIRMIVGADKSDRHIRYGGSAYVYRHERIAGWVLEQELGVGVVAEWDRFGSAVAIDDELIVVGGWQADDNGEAHVFTRAGTTWTLDATLTPGGTVERAKFGDAVGVDGDTFIVGAPGTGSGTGFDVAGPGAAYVYAEVVGVWTASALTPSVALNSDASYGSSVDIVGDVAFVGAPGEGSHGAVYVFRNTEGTWAEEAVIASPVGAVGGGFGGSVSGAATRLAIGASGANGEAYIYNLVGGVWALAASLRDPSTVAGDRFGQSVALSGDTLAVGAFRDNSGAVSRGGVVFVYEFDGTIWADGGSFVAGDATTGARFGAAVATTGNRIAVGAIRDSNDGAAAGAAYVLE